MSEHKATLEQWAELRAKVEALEAQWQAFVSSDNVFGLPAVLTHDSCDNPALLPKPDSSPVSAEQEARNLLERMGVEGAQNLKASDLTELGNLISNQSRLLAKQTAPAPAGSLVERVATAMQPGTFDYSIYEPEARAAIREVAAWLRSEYPRREGYGTAWANLIEEESNRG